MCILQKLWHVKKQKFFVTLYYGSLLSNPASILNSTASLKWNLQKCFKMVNFNVEIGLLLGLDTLRYVMIHYGKISYACVLLQVLTRIWLMLRRRRSKRSYLHSETESIQWYHHNRSHWWCRSGHSSCHCMTRPYCLNDCKPLNVSLLFCRLAAYKVLMVC